MQPPWMLEAAKWLGVKEIAGPNAAPEIIQFARDAGLYSYVSDEETWCSIFLAACIKRTLPDEPLPHYPQWSRGYAKWGVPISEPIVGAIGVFWRGERPELDLGHTAIYTGNQTLLRVEVLGGNQSDSVSIISQWKDKLIAWRWPSTFPLPEDRA